MSRISIAALFIFYIVSAGVAFDGDLKSAEKTIKAGLKISSIDQVDEGVKLAVRVNPLAVTAQDDAEKRKRVDDEIAKLIEKRRVPGVSVALIQDFKIAWAKGYGLKEAGGKDKVDKNTLFQAASISKPVVAMGVLKLVQDGKLKLDEDANEKLKSWKLPEHDSGKDITVRLLLCHGAGLTVHGFGGYGTGKEVPTLRQVLNGEKPANSAAIRSDWEPGKGYRYSGGGYCVLQQLVLDVSGKSFPEFMKETVLKPLGMKASSYEQPLPESRHKKAATAHGRGGKKVKGKWHVYPEMAAAGLWTTPTDLATFAIELQKALAGKSEKVLSQKTVKEMFKAQVDKKIGLGIFRNGDWFNHGGANAGYRCYLIGHRTSGDGAVVMTNSDLGGRLRNEIVKLLAKEYDWPKK